MKRLLVFLSVFIILISSLTVFSSAVINTVVPVPWQKPSGPTITMLYKVNSDNTFRVRQFEVVLPEHIPLGQYQLYCNVSSTALAIYISVQNTQLDVGVVSRTFNQNNSNYTLTVTTSQNISGNNVRLLHSSFPSSSSNTMLLIESDGIPINADISLPASASFTYEGQVSTVFENFVINTLSGMKSDNSAVISLLNGINTKIQTSNGKFDNMIDIMQGDPIPPFEPPTNSDVSDFEDAEGAIYDSALSVIEDFSLEAFDPSSGSLGSAFQWLNENLEFYTSNSSFRTAILVILSLSVVSVLLKIYV